MANTPQPQPRAEGRLFDLEQVRREARRDARASTVPSPRTTRWTCIMFEKILADEEDHANDLSDLLTAIDPRTEPRSDGSP